MTNDFYAVSQLVAEFQDKLKVIVERDGSRHMMDAHIDFQHDGFA
jgi:very-short-patch-repair endonuclease